MNRIKQPTTSQIFFILLSIVLGYFLPNHSFNSLLLLIIILAIAFILGLSFYDMINGNSLFSKDDLNKVRIKNKISLRGNNIQSLWIGVFSCAAAIASLLKVFLLFQEFSELGIIILMFGIGVIIRVYDFNSKLEKSVSWIINL